MTWRDWMEIIIVFVLWSTLFGSICYRIGVHVGTKWEKYRNDTKATTRKQPYSGMFDGENQHKNKIPPLKVRAK